MKALIILLSLSLLCNILFFLFIYSYAKNGDTDKREFNDIMDHIYNTINKHDSKRNNN